MLILPDNLLLNSENLNFFLHQLNVLFYEDLLFFSVYKSGKKIPVKSAFTAKMESINNSVV